MKKSLSLILTAVLLLCFLVSCGGKTSDQGATEDMTDSVTEIPTAPDDEKPNGSEQAPTENPTEQNTEAPTEDTPKVKFLKSDTGTQLNMILEYEVMENDEGKSVLDVVLKLESYSLTVTGRDNTNCIRIGNESFYFATEAINYNGTEQATFTIAEHEFELEGGEREIPVYAIWHFNGTYNQKPLATILIDDKIILE